LMLDKSQGLVLGSELVVNGTFDSDTSGWNVTAPVTIDSISGQANINRSGGSVTGFPRQDILTEGVTYLIQLDVISSSHNVSAYVGGEEVVFSAIGTHVVRVAAGSDGLGLRIGPTGASNATCIVDNISVKEIPGNHATQSVSASRPTYRTDGTLHWLEFDGVDDNMYTSANFGLSLNSSVFASAAFVNDDVNQNFTSIFSQNAGSPRNCFNLSIGDNATSGLSRIGTDVWQPAGLYGDTNITQSSPYVGTWMIDDWATHFTTGANLYLNGVVETLNVFNGANTPLSITNAPLYLGEFGGALSNSRLNGNFYGGVIIRDDIGTQDERVDIESYLAEKSGVTL
jgi:hypothetical protein